MLYLNETFEGNEFIKKELIKKLNGYKNQDKKKKILNISKLINYNKLVEILVISKLKCYYCKCNTKLFYSKVRDMEQWTLDRIDNEMGHNSNNVVICCLGCNLERRNTNMEKFLFTKQLRILKV